MFSFDSSHPALCRVDSTEVIERQLKRKRLVVVDASEELTYLNDFEVGTFNAKKSRRSPAKRSVSFLETHQVIPAPSVERPPTWYSREDYAAFKAAIRQDVMHMALLCHSDSLRKLDFSEHSVLGIEKYCCASHEQIGARQVQKQLIQAVLNQQALQKALNLKDEETIRLTSLVYTHQRAFLAFERAKALCN